MRISITSGRAEGPTKLNTFDNALLNAGIGDVNLIKVSSILPKDAEIVPVPELTPGDMTNSVLSYVSSDNEGDIISAFVAVAIADEFGCVVENTGINRNPDDVKSEAEEMARYMVDVRGMKLKEIIIEGKSHIVKKQGAVVAAVVYLD
jgi:arginine decarboxylase